MNVPDSDIVPLVCRGEVLRSLDGAFWDDNRLIRPGYDVVFTRREIDEFHERVSKSLLRLP